MVVGFRASGLGFRAARDSGHSRIACFSSRFGFRAEGQRPTTGRAPETSRNS